MSFNRYQQARRLETLKSEALTVATEVEQRALSLVNPASGLANDYLNLFNEVVMLIEQLPSMPDLIDDLQAWRPKTYREYFTQSPLPGGASAIEVYEQLETAFKASFDAAVAELDRQATAAVVQIRRHFRTKRDSDPEGFAALCAKSGAALRESLGRANAIVNSGVEGMQRHAQARADRLLAVRLKAIKDLESFINAPLFPGNGDDAGG